MKRHSIKLSLWLTAQAIRSKKVILRLADDRLHSLLGLQGPSRVAGYRRIHHDEQRQIGDGTWFLREAVSANVATAELFRRTTQEMLPAVAESLTPPEGAGEALLGVSTDEVRVSRSAA
jgi:hypothetical protein